MNFRSRYFKRNVGFEKGAMDMTPLIDVVFQLLIFFLLSSSFVLQPGIKVELPTVELPSGEKPAGVSISILRNGLLFLEDEKIQMNEIKVKLVELRKHNKESLLIIKADRKAVHGRVVEVMALAKEAGYQDIAIATKPGFLDQMQTGSAHED
jgi:biopolymer transport protein ExbD